MQLDTENLLNSILTSLDRIEYIKPEDIPGIDLYMDQVTTFMDTRLRMAARYPENDKILTKTMINNYAKNDLLPPPIRKKYSKEHMLVLIFIYYYKSILSIGDIQSLLAPLTGKYFGQDGEITLEDIYRDVFSLEESQIEVLKADVVDKFRRSEETFKDVPEDEREFLQRFSFICLLGFDVYVKKLMIEKIIDEMLGGDDKAEKKNRKDKKDKPEKADKKDREDKEEA